MRPRRPDSLRAGLSTVALLAITGAVAVAGLCGVIVAYLATGGPSEPPAASATDVPPVDKTVDGKLIAFGSVIANLAEGKLTRYLKVNITVLATGEQAGEVERLVTDTRKAVFQNWLITYLSDKQIEDIKGANSIKRLQREIQDGFNAILAESGGYKVDRVFFVEYNIQ